ncbi:hypothetical protein [Streptomyces sp. WM6386]|uniref:hypothetical protein n=1 Tax=Streptomyces sp. WM6386 TaxID=1415558 RepID=UPI00131B5681|nr:hypothetical protein [Streptomyces sp. WM6386]
MIEAGAEGRGCHWADGVLWLTVPDQAGAPACGEQMPGVKVTVDLRPGGMRLSVPPS